ncbi:acetylxylan esterase [Bacillus sp. IB182487]|uniref:Acetylxylan esterase n=2 Tax=Metabacillus arenae TaxID=2771434 RepID=A0A926ND98_9BACI|nr:acetylxylan esterase [Metabacillus arenae]
MWDPGQYIEKLYHQTVRNDTETYNEEWKQNLKAPFQKSMGEFSIPPQEKLKPALLEKVETDDYKQLRVEITTTESLKAPVYVLIPKRKEKTKLPVVLALHGHGYGSKEVIGMNSDGTENLEEPGIHKNFALELVRKGMIVAAPEMIGFGDRKLAEDRHSNLPTVNSCFSLASQLLLMGKTLPGLRVFECRRVLDYISSLDEVDPERIGCMGFSGGGLVAAFTSVLDLRIKATVITGYTNTFKGSIMARRHCLDNYIPGILQLAEMPELIGLIAPRPLFIEAGTRDHLFPIRQVEEALKTLNEIYQDFDRRDALAHHFFKGNHEICGDQSIDWLLEMLNKI